MVTKKTDQAAPADLNQFDSLVQAQEDGIDVQIKDPRGQPMGFSIRIAGPDSTRQKEAQQRLIDQRLAERVTAQLTSRDIAQANMQVIAESTIGWTDFKLDGGIFPFSTDNAKALYTRFPFIREQVDAAAGSRADFLQKSGGSSDKQSETGATAESR